MIEMLERLGHGAEGRRFESRLGATGDWIALYTEQKMVTFFIPRTRIKQQKERTWLHHIKK